MCGTCALSMLEIVVCRTVYLFCWEFGFLWHRTLLHSSCRIVPTSSRQLYHLAHAVQLSVSDYGRLFTAIDVRNWPPWPDESMCGYLPLWTMPSQAIYVKMCTKLSLKCRYLSVWWTTEVPRVPVSVGFITSCIPIVDVHYWYASQVIHHCHK